MSGDLPQGAGAFAPGSRLGRYLLEEQIGQGGMAAVFAARDENLGRMVALKILAPTLAADDAFRQRFIRESRAAAAVDDPHIIPLFEAGEAGGVLFIAMRYVPGGDVRSLLAREGPLAVDRAASIVSAVASALDAAHAAGLVHRDVKPANMLLDMRPGRPDHVYLSDFGLARDAVGPTGLTQSGLFLGTVDYAAPEQIGGRPVDGRTDQYALACAAFEMLTGQPPFPRDLGMAVLAAHLTQPPPPVTAGRPGLPPALDAVLGRALAKSPQDRYRTCGEFSDALRQSAGMGRYDAGSRSGHPRTEAAWPVPWAGGHAGAPGAPGAGAPGAGDTAGTAPAHAWPGGPTFPDRHGGLPAGDGTGYDRRSGVRWPIVVAAAAIVVAASIAAVALIVTARPGQAPAAATAPAGSPAVSTPPAGSPPPRSPAAGQGPSSAGGPPAASWTTYHDPSGFSVGLPAGWAVSSSTPGDVRFTGSPAGFVVVVAWGHHPMADALADWRQQAAAKAASDPTYQQISVRRVTYRGYNAADWEFTNIYQGVLTHVLDRTFIVQPGHLAYALELYGPDAGWPPVYAAMWQRLLTSFEPGS